MDSADFFALMTDSSILRLGTRGSPLARWQAGWVADQLSSYGIPVELVPINTQGDLQQVGPIGAIGTQGVFTKELQRALLDGRIDLAVHSLKDLPTEFAPEFAIGAVPERASVHDVLISRSGLTLAQLPPGAVVGTSSLRRGAQLRAIRPDLTIQSLRGNVPTRVRKALAADPDQGAGYDAIVLAEAGLVRLQMDAHITETLSPSVMLPAPAQGALGVQCRAADQAVLNRLAALDHTPTRQAVTAERAFLHALDSGCRLPVAAWARGAGDWLTLTGRVISLDGTQVITVEQIARPSDAEALGRALADEALAQGAGQLLDAIRLEQPE